MSDMTRREWHQTTFGTLMAAGLQGREAPSQGGRARPYKYVHLDVFTDRALTGNQLAVFVEPAGLTAEAMAAMTREMSYSECTFLFPPEADKTDFRLRIFGRIGNEMQFAGHPTIGTAFALAHTGQVKPGRARVVLGLGIGPTPVDLEWRDNRLSFAWMTQLLPTFGQTVDDVEGIAAALGVDASAIKSTGLPIEEVSCGSPFFFVPMTTRQAVDAAALNRAALDAVFERAKVQRRGVFVFSPEKADDDAAAYSRMLSATGQEDPATGSASGPLGCYMVKHKLVAPARSDHFVSRQGVKIGRPSRIHISIGVKGDTVTHVKVGGESVVVGEGTLVGS